MTAEQVAEKVSDLLERGFSQGATFEQLAETALMLHMPTSLNLIEKVLEVLGAHHKQGEAWQKYAQEPVSADMRQYIGEVLEELVPGASTLLQGTDGFSLTRLLQHIYQDAA